MCLEHGTFAVTMTLVNGELNVPPPTCGCTRAELIAKLAKQSPLLADYLKAAETAANPDQGIPFFITAAHKVRLRKMGYGDDGIARMTPAEAHEILNVKPASNGRSSTAEEPPSPRDNRSLTPPRADMAEIRRALQLLCEPGEVYGLVMLKLKSRRGEETGFFDSQHREQLIQQAVNFSGKCEAVCISLNPCHRSALALRQNRVEWAGKGDSVAKTHIKRRALLFVDYDAIREGGISGISATDEEKAGAAQAIQPIRSLFPCKPLAGIDSGNGYQDIFRVNEPADEETDRLFARIAKGLNAFAKQIGIAAEIDETVASRNRLIKIPGTLAAKGEQGNGRVHRLARIIEATPDAPIISHAELVGLANSLLPEESTPSARQSNGTAPTTFDSQVWLRDWVVKFNVPVRNEHEWDGGALMWEIDCINDSTHNSGEAFLGARGDGKYVGGCQHQHCTWKWEDLREHFEPGYKQQRKNTDPDPRRPTVQNRRTSGVMAMNVKARPLRWLWRYRIPRGMICGFEGDPGEGKSLIVADLTGRITSGADFPDGAPCMAGNVIILSGEDDDAVTLRPRLEAAGADLSKVRLWTKHLPILPAELSRLTEVIKADSAVAVFLDPIDVFYGDKIDPNSNPSVRKVLHPLADAAAALDCAIVPVRHLNKDIKTGRALYRGSGTIGFTGQARSVFLANPTPDDPEVRAFARVKGNLSKPPPTLGYRIVEAEISDGDGGTIKTQKIVWTGELNLSADALVREPMPEARGPKPDKLETAIAFLRELLKDGAELPSEEIYAQAKTQGIARGTLWKAKDELGIKARKKGMVGDWLWYLPSSPGIVKPSEQTH